MWTMLAFWACGGNAPVADRPAVERTAPWSELALPEGRTVVSEADGLVVRYPHDDVATVDRDWRAALQNAGFAVVEDTSRGGLTASSWARDAQTLALSVSAIRGTTTVSLQDLP